MNNKTFLKIGIILVAMAIVAIPTSLESIHALSLYEQVNIYQENNQTGNQTGNQSKTNTTVPQAFS